MSISIHELLAVARAVSYTHLVTSEVTWIWRRPLSGISVVLCSLINGLPHKSSITTMICRQAFIVS